MFTEEHGDSGVHYHEIQFNDETQLHDEADRQTHEPVSARVYCNSYKK